MTGEVRPSARLNSVVTAGGMLLQQALGFIGGVFVAKLLGPADYGEVSVLRSILTIIIVVTPLGLDLALFRILPRFDNTPHEQTLHFRRFRIIVFASGIVMTLLGSMLIGPLLASHIYDYTNFKTNFALTLLAIPFASDVLLMVAWFRVQGNIIPILGITYYFQPIVRTVLNVLAVYLGYGVMGVVIGTTFAYVVGFLLAVPYYAWTQRERESHGRASEAPDWKVSWQHFREAPSMALNLFAYSIMRTADLAIVGAIAATHAVGEYAVVSNIAQLVPVAATSLMQTLGPAIARHHNKGDDAAVARDINNTIRLATILGGFIFGGIAGFGEHLDVIFGPAYKPDPAITVLIPLGYLISAALSPTSYALTMCGRSKTDLAILMLSSAVLVGTCIPFTMAYGTVGAAISVIIAFTLINLLRLIAANRLLGVRLGSWADIIPPALAFAIATALNHLITSKDTNLFRLLLACTLYVVLYGSIMISAPAYCKLRKKLKSKVV
jgi:O-antigen/teichoic acid export membrane protein